MQTQQQAAAKAPQRTSLQRHKLGMGWHYVWRYDPPIEHLMHTKDGTPYYWREDGETSEGCIVWLADNFAIQKLGTTAREIYQAYRQKDGEQFEDDWLATDGLRDAWAEYTVLPKLWTPAHVRKLFHDLEDVNYHTFLARLIELVEQRVPKLAAALDGWCNTEATKPEGALPPS